MEYIDIKNPEYSMILQKQEQNSNNLLVFNSKTIGGERAQTPYLPTGQFRGKNEAFTLPFLYKLHFEMTKKS